MDYNDFINKVKKVKKKRTHKVTNSYGSKDAFFYYRKTKPNDSKYILTDCQYLKIIRTINNYIRDIIIEGGYVDLPERMGCLELRKTINTFKFEDGKLKTSMPVDWNATLKLWYESPECKNKKTLVRHESLETFRLHYNKTKANYNNKSFYEFNTNRTIKRELKKNINKNKIDAYKYG